VRARPVFFDHLSGFVSELIEGGAGEFEGGFFERDQLVSPFYAVVIA
jgi:hypothetical protein